MQVLKSTILKIIVDYCQILTLIQQLDDWPSVAEVFQGVFTKAEPTNREGFSMECFIELSNG
jgi:hypothetical protein